jgi:cell division transport system ATP-binding protein
MIVLDHVSKTYQGNQGSIQALKDVSLSIDKGEFVFVVGLSGSGKTTLFRLLLKEMEPTSGNIFMNNKNIGKLRRDQIPKFRRGIGVVFQDFKLLKNRTVFENIAFAQRIIGVPNRRIKKNVMDVLKLVGLQDKYKAKPSELSGGEQQRVALARAIVNNPPVLLADEPTGNLDPTNSTEIMKLLEKINKRGTTVVVVTHSTKIVDEMQKRVVNLNQGEIVSDEKKGGYVYV